MNLLRLIILLLTVVSVLDNIVGKGCNYSIFATVTVEIELSYDNVDIDDPNNILIFGEYDFNKSLYSTYHFALYSWEVKLARYLNTITRAPPVIFLK